MSGKILITNGGDHLPQTWAKATAEMIFDVAPTQNTDSETEAKRKFEAQKLQYKIEHILVPHHDNVQKTECDTLRSVGDNHYLTKIDPTKTVDTVLTEIVSAAQGTQFQELFNNPDTQKQIRMLLGTHFSTSMHNARMWYAKDNPGVNADAFVSTHHPGAKLRNYFESNQP